MLHFQERWWHRKACCSRWLCSQRGSSSHFNSFQRWSFWFSCFLGEAKGAQVSHRMLCVPLLETTVRFYACGWSGDHHFTCVRSAVPDGSQESPFSRTAKEILMILSAPRMAEQSPSKTRPPVNWSECYVQCVAPSWWDSHSVCLAGGKCWELQCWSNFSLTGPWPEGPCQYVKRWLYNDVSMSQTICISSIACFASLADFSLTVVSSVSSDPRQGKPPLQPVGMGWGTSWFLRPAAFCRTTHCHRQEQAAPS